MESDLSGRLGRYIETSVAGERVRAYVPAPLPPVTPVHLAGLINPLSAADRGAILEILRATKPDFATAVAP